MHSRTDVRSSNRPKVFAYAVLRTNVLRTRPSYTQEQMLSQPIPAVFGEENGAAGRQGIAGRCESQSGLTVTVLTKHDFRAGSPW